MTEQERLKRERYEQKAEEIQNTKERYRETLEWLKSKRDRAMTETEINNIDYEILDVQSLILICDMELEEYV